MLLITNLKIFESLYNNEFEKLICWWGTTGYLYYASLTHKDPPITNEGRRRLDVLYSAIINKTYNNSGGGRYDNYLENPVWCEENVWSEIGKNYIDDIFEMNQSILKTPLIVYKNYDETRFFPGKYGWYSFSTNGPYKNAFGDKNIVYQLPIGFKYINTMNLADDGEVIINGKYLTDDMIIEKT